MTIKNVQPFVKTIKCLSFILMANRISTLGIDPNFDPKRKNYLFGYLKKTLTENPTRLSRFPRRFPDNHGARGPLKSYHFRNGGWDQVKKKNI